LQHLKMWGFTNDINYKSAALFSHCFAGQNRSYVTDHLK